MLPAQASIAAEFSNVRLFQLVGTRYEERSLKERYYWFEEMALGLGVWQGEYKGVQGQWLRWQAKGGQWVPTDGERAERLRSLGINPEEV